MKTEPVYLKIEGKFFKVKFLQDAFYFEFAKYQTKQLPENALVADAKALFPAKRILPLISGSKHLIQIIRTETFSACFDFRYSDSIMSDGDAVMGFFTMYSGAPILLNLKSRKGLVCRKIEQL